MDKIVDHLFVFKGKGVVKDFPGNYSDYRTFATANPEEKEIDDQGSDNSEKKAINQAQKLSYNEQKEYKNLESKIRSLELDKKALEEKFNDVSLSQEKINELSVELQKIIEAIETKEMRWFELAEKFES